MKELCLASHNAGKIREFRRILEPAGITLVEPRPDIPEPEETGWTFLENAVIKARAIAAAMGMPAVADDSGIIVPALNDRFGFPFPGVVSARLCLYRIEDGKLVDFDPERVPAEERPARNREIIRHLLIEDGADRAAYYSVAVVVADPDGSVLFSSNGHSNRGEILVDGERGANGFSYDCIVYVREMGKTFAEMTTEEKDSISHRGRALRMLVDWYGSEQ